MKKPNELLWFAKKIKIHTENDFKNQDHQVWHISFWFVGHGGLTFENPRRIQCVEIFPGSWAEVNDKPIRIKISHSLVARQRNQAAIGLGASFMLINFVVSEPLSGCWVRKVFNSHSQLQTSKCISMARKICPLM